MSKDKQKSAPIKKGTIIDRRRNRTVNVDVAHSEPKWFHVMSGDNFTGVIQHRKTGTQIQRDKVTGHWQGIKTG